MEHSMKLLHFLINYSNWTKWWKGRRLCYKRRCLWFSG